MIFSGIGKTPPVSTADSSEHALTNVTGSTSIPLTTTDRESQTSARGSLSSPTSRGPAVVASVGLKHGEYGLIIVKLERGSTSTAGPLSKEVLLYANLVKISMNYARNRSLAGR